MIIGKMDRLLRFTTQRRVQNEYGEMVATNDVATDRWCQVNYLAGKKGWEAEGLIAEKPVEIFARYDSTIDTDQKIIIDDLEYYISSIQTINRNAGLRILAKTQQRS
jgi:SPP1 family predicted phage head-tail adaptor